MNKKLLTTIFCFVGLGFGGWFLTLKLATPLEAKPVAAQPAPTKARTVSALGRLEPEGRVIRISAPTQAEGARVAKLFVKEGEPVRAGQVVAQLDTYDRRLAALDEAREQVRVTAARLAQTKVPSKQNDQSAQRAAISRLEVELQRAEREQERYAALHRDGIVAASDFEGRKLTADTLRRELERAKSQLSALTEVRPVDVGVAEAEVGRAKASVERAEADLEAARVRATSDGTVIKIHALAGEAIGNKGILEIGQTNAMYVVAEIYENDIAAVQKGASARITARALNQPLTGVVEQIGLQVGKKDVLSTDPAADTDARVIEVRIRLNPEDSRRVAGLTNLRVEAVISGEPL